MNRNTILLLAAGLFSGLILWDRANSTDEVIAGTVTALEARAADNGPDMWHITADTELGALDLPARNARPQLKTGDEICITVRRRMARADSYFLAPAATSC